MADFFLRRPVFAWVLAILLMLSGLLSLFRLPVAQYPDIALPQIAIYGQYPGAAASNVDQSVTQVIEQEMKGIDNLLYMRSSSDSFGFVEMYFTFAAGTDTDTAQVQVQNKLSLAQPMLPEAVQRQGLQVVKAVENSFMTVAFYMENDSMRANDISDYVASHLLEPLSRVQGVGSTTLYGGQNAMRIWLDPGKMRQFGLNPSDVQSAVQGQNALTAGGQTGAAPALPGQEVTFTVIASERLNTVEAFEDICLRVEENGAVLRLRDVARVELNEESFMGGTRYNGRRGVGVAFKLSSGANVLETSRAIHDMLDSLSRFYPPGLRHAFADDRAPVVEQSIRAVVRTLLETVVLVVAVMFLFLQSVRATFIPTVAVPVVMLGAFAVLAVLGFSINTLTLFGMVLATGLLVDDAIVVVENAERIGRVEGLTPGEAAAKSMRQITGALIGVAVVIAAVFVPMALMSGPTGIIYRQFSVTIVSAMLLSVLVAIILTPTLCASLLGRRRVHGHEGFFGRFNRWFDRLTKHCCIALRLLLRRPAVGIGCFILCIACCVALYLRLPGAFLPDEDQGVLFVDVLLPPGSSFERTERVLAEIDRYFREEEKDSVESVMAIHGWGFSGSGQAAAMVIPTFRDWSERGPEQGVFAVMERAQRRFAAMPEAEIFVMAPPAVMELGTSGGFDIELMDRSALGHHALMAARDQLLSAAAKHPDIAYARFSGMDDSRQYRLSVNVAKAGALGLDKSVINDAVECYWGGRYINDFEDRGRTKKVYMQAEPAFRRGPDDFFRFHVRNGRNEMVPFSSFLSVETGQASPKLFRYQGVPSVKILGEAAPGKSSGEAMQAMEACAAELPAGFDTAWTGLSLQEQMSRGQAPFMYAISLIVVFLTLAALYESWSIPLAVLLSVPAGIIGALAGVSLRGMNNDVYFQIALLTTAGLSAKHAILIVEFARTLHESGRDLVQSAVEAVRLRLRPIVMTSLCFILGVIPLCLSSGAGSGAQNALGTAVFSGMIASTVLGVFFTPLFFVLVGRLVEGIRGRRR